MSEFVQPPAGAESRAPDSGPEVGQPAATDELARLAALLQTRNAIDTEIADLTGRPALAGHLGEWIASRIFDIELEQSAVAPGIDGRFASGPLARRSVNVKWYGKREGALDLLEDSGADYYLVMTGPKGTAASSRGATRPLVIAAVYLFATPELIAELRTRGVKIGVAASVRMGDWDAAEIFPRQMNPALPLSDEQRGALELFVGTSGHAPVVSSREGGREKTAKITQPPAVDGDRDHSSGVQVFRGDDSAYLRWLGENPTGYVVNAERSLNPRSLNLHHASCRWISGPPRSPGAWTERDYIKICSPSAEPLSSWARGDVGVSLDRGCSCT